MKPSLILINPWIYDFAAYDLWSKPLGLLYIAGYLRCCGFSVHLIDCLDTHHPEMTACQAPKQPTRRLYGTGKFFREKARKPDCLSAIPRTYSRYGITETIFIKELQKVQKPVAILVTSLMTYWYPGVIQVIDLCKRYHPGVPVILGGIYARLCREHAMAYSGADLVASRTGLSEVHQVGDYLAQCGITPPAPLPGPPEQPYPAFDMLRKIDYVCLMTSSGCPYTCPYCASSLLSPGFSSREPEKVLEEILFWCKQYGVKDFAFYDDALLVNSTKHMAVLLKNLIRKNLNLRFHTPNALHVREMNAGLARLFFLSGFKTIRLGLETSDSELHRRLGSKVSEGEFERAVENLRQAGFENKQIGAYILVGLPGQSVASVMETIDFVGTAGVTPFLSEYSPIPHTTLWKTALSCSQYNLAAEPLYHNNTLLPCWNEEQRRAFPRLRRRVLEIRRTY